MRVAVYHCNSDIRIEKRPRPKIGKGELLVRVEASGICGSDVMEWYRIKKAPLVLGHEIAGLIEEVGEGVEQYSAGDRIVAAHHVPCNTCSYCLKGHHTACNTLRATNFDPGGFSEYVRLPAINVDRGVFRIPDSVSYEEASMTEPLACVFRAQRIAGIQPGDTVLVLGSGMAGLLHVSLACALGAGRVVATDISENRLEAARRFGAEVALNANEDLEIGLRRCNDGRLADKVIVCAGAKNAATQALRLAERGATIMYFAPTDPEVTIPFSISKLFFQGLTVTTSYAANQADHETAMALIRSKRVPVREMITHRIPLAETGKGFGLVAAAQNSMKVIVEPQR